MGDLFCHRAVWKFWNSERGKECYEPKQVSHSLHWISTGTDKNLIDRWWTSPCGVLCYQKIHWWKVLFPERWGVLGQATLGKTGSDAKIASWNMFWLALPCSPAGWPERSISLTAACSWCSSAARTAHHHGASAHPAATHPQVWGLHGSANHTTPHSE